MKKSEILKHLNKDESNNVENYYRYERISMFGKDDLLIVYAKEITWEHIEKWGKDIIDITTSEYDSATIRISIENVEFD